MLGLGLTKLNPRTIFLLCLILIFVTLLFTKNASATSPSLWVNDQPINANAIHVNDYLNCEWRYAPLVTEQSILPKTQRMCVFQTAHASVGRYSGSYAIRYGTDRNFHRLDLGIAADISFIPSKDVLVYDHYTRRGNSGTNEFGYINLMRDIHPDARDPLTGIVLKYSTALPDHLGWLESKFGDMPLHVVEQNGKFMASSDSNYIVVSIENVGLLKIDIENETATFIASHWDDIDTYHLANITYDPLPAAVSDEGRYVFAVGSKSLLYDTADCGDSVSAARQAYDARPPFSQDGFGKYHMIATCQARDISPEVNGVTDETMVPGTSQESFSENGTVLRFTDFLSYPLPQMVKLGAPGHPLPPPLEYLALGDSYSSGEGDYANHEDDRHSNFLPHTDDPGPPREMCHISYHSYPFLLRDHYDIDTNLMHSVACSGARTIDVERTANASLGVVDEYHGQGNHLLKIRVNGKYSSDQERYDKDSALAEFIPGRIEQIDFVRKYQPKVVTVGIGGNDVNFSGLIISCAVHDDTCSEAAKNNSSRHRLARSIRSEFPILRNLYIDLRRASPSTDVYAIGYPQFIADSSSPCEYNAGLVNSSERHLMNEGTHYMNQVIEAAAKSAGVQYINIEHNLDGGRLCEGVFTDYVTGIRDEWWRQLIKDNSLNEYLYHPNSLGHAQIAKAIERAIGPDFLVSNDTEPDYSITAPDYPSYFSDAGDTTTLSTSSLESHILKRGVTIDSSSIRSIYQDNSSVTVTAHSLPQKVGTFKTDGAGNLNFYFTVPKDFPTGYHELVFDGTSPSGEPVEYVESFFVIGDNPNDLDGDGLIDSKDQCMFTDTSDAENMCNNKTVKTSDVMESKYGPTKSQYKPAGTQPNAALSRNQKQDNHTGQPENGIQDINSKDVAQPFPRLPISNQLTVVVAVIFTLLIIVIIAGIIKKRKRNI